MKQSIPELSATPNFAPELGFADRISRKLVIKRLQEIKHGCLIVHEHGHEYSFGSTPKESEKPIVLHIDHSSVWRDLALGGTTSGGEAYIKGHWRCSDIVGLVRLFLRNADVLDELDYRFTRLSQPLHKALHWLSRNSRKGSRKNIAAHYDLGNAFFALFLDKRMMYSSAFYPNEAATLDEAATCKLERICKKIDLQADDHIIEIGTGWGGFAIYAAQHYGCKVTTTTLSKEQYQLAKKRVEEAGLSEQITLLLKDYRDLEGRYDKLVSIEMVEAVGHQYLDNYFKQCSRLLKQDGLMLIQAITIADQYYKRALSEVDFIKKYIFPGGFLSSISTLSTSIANASNLQIVHLEDIGLHYARTLADWRERFFEQAENVKKMGYPASFSRMWEFYLCYCEGGFLENYIGTVQLLASKPQATLPSFNSEIEPVYLNSD